MSNREKLSESSNKYFEYFINPERNTYPNSLITIVVNSITDDKTDAKRLSLPMDEDELIETLHNTT